jgi:hypothetical protein
MNIASLFTSFVLFTSFIPVPAHCASKHKKKPEHKSAMQLITSSRPIPKLKITILLEQARNGRLKMPAFKKLNKENITVCALLLTKQLLQEIPVMLDDSKKLELCLQRIDQARTALNLEAILGENIAGEELKTITALQAQLKQLTK